jgi:hypothetical protein
MTNPFNEAVEEISEKFAAKEKRIADLEEDNANLAEHKRYYLEYIKFHCDYDSITRLVSEHLKLKKNQATLKLEQQAKGIERVLCSHILGLTKRERIAIKLMAERLREQAKQLKEQPNV